jgi:hypothetical protein
LWDSISRLIALQAETIPPDHAARDFPWLLTGSNSESQIFHFYNEHLNLTIKKIAFNALKCLSKRTKPTMYFITWVPDVVWVEIVPEGVGSSEDLLEGGQVD